jgi:hypothetical protein
MLVRLSPQIFSIMNDLCQWCFNSKCNISINCQSTISFEHLCDSIESNDSIESIGLNLNLDQFSTIDINSKSQWSLFSDIISISNENIENNDCHLSIRKAIEAVKSQDFSDAFTIMFATTFIENIFENNEYLSSSLSTTMNNDLNLNESRFKMLRKVLNNCQSIHIDCFEIHFIGASHSELWNIPNTILILKK